MDNKIKQWAIDRNLHTADPSKQFLKLVEELGELASAMARNDKELIDDSIGDIHVVLTIMKMQLDHSDPDGGEEDWFPEDIDFLDRLLNNVTEISSSMMGYRPAQIDIDYMQDVLKGGSYNITDTPYDECVLSAYNEIKDRKGKMVDGVFVKESDLSV